MITRQIEDLNRELDSLKIQKVKSNFHLKTGLDSTSKISNENDKNLNDSKIILMQFVRKSLNLKHNVNQLQQQIDLKNKNIELISNRTNKFVESQKTTLEKMDIRIKEINDKIDK